MSKRAEEAALKICPPMIVKDEDGSLDDLTYMARTWVQKGYEQAEKDTVDRAAEWWYEHIVGFMSEGLVKNVIEEFREAMADEDTSTTK
jgi:hypothetical protein